MTLKTKIVSKYELVIADFKTVALKFEKQGIEKSLVDSILEKFKAAKDKNKIKDNKEKDIDFWGKGAFEDFKDFVQNLTEVKTSTEVKNDIKAEGAELVKEDSNWKVFRVKSKDACFLLGSGTKWCITEKDSEHWDSYSAKNNFYFLISKTLPKTNSKYKIAMTVDSSGEKDFWDAKDKKFSKLPPSLKVPKFEIENFEFSWKNFQGKEDIDVRNIDLTTLEGAPQKVGGRFSCSKNKLTSLEGAPKEVGGGFYCLNNQLTSLEGAPKEVGGNFYCSDNQLTSLAGAPKEVEGQFFCDDNKLTSLEGAPQKVGGAFSCIKNSLTSLEGAPQEVVGGSFYCSQNKLTSLKGAPQKVGGDFRCSNNKLTSLAGAPKEVKGNFSCSDNKKKFTEEEVRAVCKVGGKVSV